MAMYNIFSKNTNRRRILIFLCVGVVTFIVYSHLFGLKSKENSTLLYPSKEKPRADTIDKIVTSGITRTSLSGHVDIVAKQNSKSNENSAKPKKSISEPRIDEDKQTEARHKNKNDENSRKESYRSEIKDEITQRGNVDIDDESRETRIEDILFTVKTGFRFHKTRLQLLLDTWVFALRNQVYVVTDEDANEYEKRLPLGHLVESGCAWSHLRRDLCCKMGYELKTMLKHVDEYRWFCRADDDTYYHGAGILADLRQHNWTAKVVVGAAKGHIGALRPKESFVYPIGNAGVCLSRSLVRAIAPYIAYERFPSLCVKHTLNDDVMLGVIALEYAGGVLETGEHMYGHGYARKFIFKKGVRNIATINYRDRSGVVMQVVLEPISPVFDRNKDPSQVYSLHCHLHPTVPYCKPLFPNGTNDVIYG